MKIRLETENDYNEVENLVRNTFWNIYRPGAYEHYIVHNLRNHESFIKELAYIIEKDNKIIGHINYSKGKIIYKDKEINAIILGPISIDKEFQNKGYGTKLIKHTINIIKEKNIPFIIVVGDKKYYHRFGFETASKYNIYLEGTKEDEKSDFFMIKIFNKNKIDFKKGIFQIPIVFNVNEKDVEEFDKKFEYKERKIIKGQLTEGI